MSQNVPENSLTPAQLKAIEALMSSTGVGAAAEKAGVNRKTLYRWLKEPEFRMVLRDVESSALHDLGRSLTALSKGAVAVLANTLTGAERDPGKLRACEIVLSNLLKVREFVDLEARITELERIQYARELDESL